MKGAWLAPAGALVALVIAGAAAIGFVRWRSAEQEYAMNTHSARCRADSAESCDWLRNACTKRAATACYALAEIYLSGRGVPQSYGEALALGTDACDLGSAEGCLLIGELLSDGTGVRKDPERAVTVFERACALGNEQGCRWKQRAER